MQPVLNSILLTSTNTLQNIDCVSSAANIVLVSNKSLAVKLYLFLFGTDMDIPIPVDELDEATEENREAILAQINPPGK